MALLDSKARGARPWTARIACAVNGGLLAVVALQVTAPASTTTLTRGPYLQLLTTSSVTIVWNTDVAAACSLAIRPVGGSATVIDGGVGTVCAIPVTGLSPGAAYAYTPAAGGVALGEESTFRTDGGQDRFSFLVVGDSGSGGSKQASVRDAMLGTPADFVLHTGDMVYEDGAPEDFDPHFFRPYADLVRRLVVWPSLGNHDLHTGDGAPWREAFWTPANNPAGDEAYYSFDFGTAHVVVLDTNQPTDAGSPQHTFLDQDLAGTAAVWKFVVFHHTIYSSGAHGSDEPIRANLLPLLDGHGVDVVFMGHEHDYERTVLLRGNVPATPGTLYVTTGGGGGELRRVDRSGFTAYAESIFHFVRVQVDDGWLLAQMIREDGVVRDSVVLEKGGTPPPAVCGDGLVNRAAEQCDGADRAPCPAATCLPDCTCPPVCGDGRQNQPSEECDELDDTTCPGRCLAACRCGAPEEFVTLAPVADTFIVAGNGATWDHGAAEDLEVDDEPTSIAYLKFDVRDVTAPIRAATLLLGCNNNSPDGGTVYALPDSSWVEGDRTGTDAGSAGGPGLTFAQVDTNGDDKVDARDTSPFAPDLYHWVATLGPVSAGTIHAVNVTSALAGGPGVYTLVVKSQTENGAEYGSREEPDVEDRPFLRLELDRSCDDGLVCTADTFDPGTGCQHTPVAGCCLADADCDDGLACTGHESCATATGECRPGTPVACGDGNRCNGTETCNPTTGSCVAGTPLACDDGDACTADVCDPVAGCTHDPLGGVAGADCLLRVLQGVALCAPDGLDPKLAGKVAKSVARARVLLGKAMAATVPRRTTRFVGLADQELLRILFLARKRART